MKKYQSPKVSLIVNLTNTAFLSGSFSSTGTEDFSIIDVPGNDQWK